MSNTSGEVNVKEWWKSKTVIGGVIAMLVGLANALTGNQVDVSAQEHGMITDSIVSLAGLIGGIMAIVGRFMATSTLK